MIAQIRVTDHAVLRYLERAHGLDIDALRNHLAGLAVSGVQLGAVGVTIENVKLMLAGETVVTVLERHMLAWPQKDHGGK